MKRKITSKLYEWKNMLKGRMPLLIYGARQVGKTFEMREFGALYYKNTIYVNFETDERIGKYFETDIHADHVISVLEKYYQAKIVPENTLIIFDEIQMCERALTSLKYFSEEAPEYHVMAAGSLLGVAMNREKYSFPVGKVQMLTMYPMDLEEVLWAKGKQMLADTIREHFENNQPLDEILHEEAMQEFYHYCIVGGMPAAVKADLAKDSPIEQTEIRQIAISNRRIEGIEGDKVIYKAKDYKNGGKMAPVSVEGAEFIRMFLMHVLPKGFVRIRHYGLLACRCKKDKMTLCRNLLGCEQYISQLRGKTVAEKILILYKHDITKCRCCGEPVRSYNVRGHYMLC